MNIHSVRFLRKIVLSAFSKFNLGDIKIRHQYTNDLIKIHSYKHKGYWYHGKNRERNEMTSLAKLINTGDIVIDAGGHIGYISLYFAKLIGEEGAVHIFEPGLNNFPYLKYNVGSKKNIFLNQMGLNDSNSSLTFYVEHLSGQNNSFVKDCETFECTLKNSFDSNVKKEEVMVDTIKLDDYVTDKIRPNFIKIDVEGFEYNALRGMTDILKESKPRLMVEIVKDRTEICNLLLSYNYKVYDSDLNLVTNTNEPTACINYFFIHEDDKFHSV